MGGHRLLYEYQTAAGEALYRGKTTQTFAERDAKHHAKYAAGEDPERRWYGDVDHMRTRVIDQGRISMRRLAVREQEFIGSDGGTLANVHHNGGLGRWYERRNDWGWAVPQRFDFELEVLYSVAPFVFGAGFAVFVVGCTIAAH